MLKGICSPLTARTKTLTTSVRTKQPGAKWEREKEGKQNKYPIKFSKCSAPVDVKVQVHPRE